MVEEIAIASVSPVLSMLPYIFLVVLLGLLFYGILLLIKSKNFSSKSLKIGIILPLIMNTVLLLSILFWAFRFGDSLFYLVAIFGAIPIFILSILSISFSIFSMIKLDEKSLPLASLIYGLVFLAYSGFILISILFFDALRM